MNVNVSHSECSERLEELDSEIFDSCITDPPYHYGSGNNKSGSKGFMGKEWDRSGIAFDPEFWKKVKRVLKPGSHLAAFGGSETSHRLKVAIEDAGFELRESIAFCYAEGFAKSHDVSKAIDKHFGKNNEREKLGLKDKASRKDGTMVDRESYGGEWKDNPSGWQERGRDPYERAPATNEAEKWEGWDTQLKPAKEPIVIARKPLEGTVAENVLEHGTGAMNIDGCRIPADWKNDPNQRGFGHGFVSGENEKKYDEESNVYGDGESFGWEPNQGRWPANVIFDPLMAERLDEQSGRDLKAGGNVKESKREEKTNVYGEYKKTSEHKSYGDVGGASRYFKTIRYRPEDNPGFFYCPKAKKKERNFGAKENDHVTVKPIELMSYLVRLLTPEQGVTLDPFAGSGTTGMSAVLEGVSAELIEKNEHYCEIARSRIKYAKENYQRLREEIYGNPSNSITGEQTEVNNHNFW